MKEECSFQAYMRQSVMGGGIVLPQESHMKLKATSLTFTLTLFPTILTGLAIRGTCLPVWFVRRPCERLRCALFVPRGHRRVVCGELYRLSHRPAVRLESGDRPHIALVQPFDAGSAAKKEIEHLLE